MGPKVILFGLGILEGGICVDEGELEFRLWDTIVLAREILRTENVPRKSSNEVGCYL